MTTPIRVACPGCNATLAVRDTMAGKTITCPKCREPMQLPTSTELAEIATAEALPPPPPPPPRKVTATRQPPPRPVMDDDREDPDADDAENRPVSKPKKKKKRKKSTDSVMWDRFLQLIGSVGGVVVVGILGYYSFKEKGLIPGNNAPAPGARSDAGPPPPLGIGAPSATGDSALEAAPADWIAGLYGAIPGEGTTPPSLDAREQSREIWQLRVSDPVYQLSNPVSKMDPKDPRSRIFGFDSTLVQPSKSGRPVVMLYGRSPDTVPTIISGVGFQSPTYKNDKGIELSLRPFFKRESALDNFELFLVLFDTRFEPALHFKVSNSLLFGSIEPYKARGWSRHVAERIRTGPPAYANPDAPASLGLDGPIVGKLPADGLGRERYVDLKGVLVGIESKSQIATTATRADAVVKGIRPVFSTTQPTARGMTRQLAPDGYAVGAFDVSFDSTFSPAVNALRPRFHKQTATGLDPSDEKLGEWFGTIGKNGKTTTLSSGGKKIIGLRLQQIGTMQVYGLGLVLESAMIP